jgi:hypothetical protein
VPVTASASRAVLGGVYTGIVTADHFVPSQCNNILSAVLAAQMSLDEKARIENGTVVRLFPSFGSVPVCHKHVASAGDRVPKRIAAIATPTLALLIAK